MQSEAYLEPLRFWRFVTMTDALTSRRLLSQKKTLLDGAGVLD